MPPPWSGPACRWRSTPTITSASRGFSCGPGRSPAANGGAPRVTVVLAGRVHTVAKGTITDGVIVIENGKITSVEQRQNGYRPPAGARVLTAAVVTPGLIDAHAVVPITGALNVPA